MMMMTTPFLSQVARHYLREGSLERTVLIFPSRRSILFFRKYLGQALRGEPGAVPVIAPGTYTIQDFFHKVYGVPETDRIRLITELYDVYREIYPGAEPLDEFIFWGDVIISDFDDVDKYLVDAKSLFANIEDLKSIQDSFSYLSPRQREAIENFISHFRDSSGRLMVSIGSDDPGMKARFLRIWNILYPLYDNYRKRLASKGLAYEGMVYGDIAARLRDGEAAKDVLEKAFPGKDKFVFVGLNALSESELLLMRKMRDARLAEFVWDWSSDMIRDPANASSVFMKDNLREFPQAFPIDPDGLVVPEVDVVSVPSATAQAKLAPWILSQTVGDPVETAFVLPDPALLQPLLNSLPESVGNVNVTMGYPLTGGAVYTLMKAVGSLQMNIRSRSDGKYFYHRPAREILSSGLLRRILTEEGRALADKVRTDAKYYIPEADLRGADPLLDLIFRPVVSETGEASAETSRALEEYFRSILGSIGFALKGDPDMLLETDFAKRYLSCLNILSGTTLKVLPSTWLSLLDRLLATVSVPFRGEPLSGLQIMGPLETRALDFRNIVILSAGEGSFPRHSQSSSFIPAELRKGFSLPTAEYQDAVWAYYFYRMIQRASHVWLVYDSRTEGLHSGEESRFIKQLEYHFRMPLGRYVVSAPMHSATSEDSIPKREEDIAAIRETSFSATLLRSWLSCQAKFYYQAVKHLKAPEEVAESLDSGMLGNVFHNSMLVLYDGKDLIDTAFIQSLLDSPSIIKDTVRAGILEEMNTMEVSGRNLVIEEVITEYVRKTLAHDKRFLAESGSEGFRILGLERKMYGSIDGFKLNGRADRMDSYIPGQVRIVDYKTGKVENDDIMIDDANAASVVEKLFGPDEQNRPGVALQLFIYDYLASLQPDLRGSTLVNSIYSTGRLFTEPLPDVPASREFSRLTDERLREMLAEIVNPDSPFRRTGDLRTCTYCDFKTICGR